MAENTCDGPFGDGAPCERKANWRVNRPIDDKTRTRYVVCDRHLPTAVRRIESTGAIVTSLAERRN